MQIDSVLVKDYVQAGLSRLQDEAFAENGLAYGAEEIASTSVVTAGMAQRTEKVLRNGTWGPSDGFKNFSRERMEEWLEGLRRICYEPGAGTWRTCRLRLFPEAPGQLEVFDEDVMPIDSRGKPVDFLAADAGTLAQDLLHFPRTVDNIPQWMWKVLRAEGVTPPVYNPELKTVDWDNKRLPVTDTGTDFTAKPIIIDPSKEPGFFTRISQKLFGS